MMSASEELVTHPAFSNPDRNEPIMTFYLLLIYP
jgi:hypothetical protein